MDQFVAIGVAKTAVEAQRCKKATPFLNTSAKQTFVVARQLPLLNRIYHIRSTVLHKIIQKVWTDQVLTSLVTSQPSMPPLALIVLGNFTLLLVILICFL